MEIKVLAEKFKVAALFISHLFSRRHAQALPVPLGPVHLNSGASVDPRGNSLCIYL